jgi:tRNA-uridine 2-sulfurtransferase
MSNQKGKVVVALSGGVDSSVAAALLLEQGFEVVGLTMRLWTDPAHPPASTAEAAAARAAVKLGIPLHVVDLVEPFRQQVVQFFLDEYARGRTPNPCVRCNRLVKWGALLDQALTLGADFLATGHYARLETLSDGTRQVLKAADPVKDQTYVLHVLTQEKLARALFPIGNYPKPEVRQLAHKFDLPAAERSESQDLCFLAGEDYRDFIRRNAPAVARPGPIVTREGKTFGEHQGLAYYTIGQRKGLGIASAVPLYVLAKEPAANTLVVGEADQLGSVDLEVSGLNWISGKPPVSPFSSEVKTRYTARAAAAHTELLPEGRARVHFDLPQRDITSGQAAVFYTGDVLLGGGLIE